MSVAPMGVVACAAFALGRIIVWMEPVFLPWMVVLLKKKRAAMAARVKSVFADICLLVVM